MGTDLKDFPSCCVWRRVRWWTENRLGSVPMVLVIPLAASVFATVLAVSQPSEAVRHGRVVSPSFFTSLALALAGGVGVVAAVVAFSIIYDWFRYRISRYRDPKFESERTVDPTGQVSIKLKSKNDSSLRVSPLEAFVRKPSGTVQPHKNVVWPDSAVASNGICLDKPTTVAGEYEVRWYGRTNNHGRYEITRHKLTEP